MYDTSRLTSRLTFGMHSENLWHYVRFTTYLIYRLAFHFSETTLKYDYDQHKRRLRGAARHVTPTN